MRWNRVSIKTTTQAEDILISALADIGIQGAQIRDNQPLSARDKEQMFVDILPDMPEDDGTAVLDFYLEEDEDLPAVLEKIRTVIAETALWVDTGEGTVTISQTEDKDWINNWKEFFHQFRVDDFLIVPSWEEVPQDADQSRVLRIDPGTAFGTGMHETTQLVMKQLIRLTRPGAELLDLGTGSGILGIVALKLGASRVMATDLDPAAISAVTDNLAANSIPEGAFSLQIGNVIDDPGAREALGTGGYDLVTANILTEVLLPLTPVAASFLKPGGYYITSGILEGKEESVAAAMKQAGLNVTETTRQGEWVCVTGKKGS